MKSVAATKTTTKTNPAEPRPDDDRAPASTVEPPASKAPASGTRPAARHLSRPVSPERRASASQELRLALEELYSAAVLFSCEGGLLTDEQHERLTTVQNAFVDAFAHVRHLEDEIARYRSNARESQHLLSHEIQRQREYATSLVGGG